MTGKFFVDERGKIGPTTRGKSESVTFRIESKALKNLRREAELKDIITNTLVNKIIKNHVNWHSNAAKAGFLTIRRPFVSKVMKYLLNKKLFLWQNTWQKQQIRILYY